jgi:hypothetical protein
LITAGRTTGEPHDRRALTPGSPLEGLYKLPIDLDKAVLFDRQLELCCAQPLNAELDSYIKVW